MEENLPQCCCAISKPFDSIAGHVLVGQDHRALTLLPAIFAHIQPLQSYICGYWTVSERLWTLLTVFWTPSSYDKTTDHSLTVTLLTIVYTPFSCCIAPSPSAEPSWTVCVMCSSIMNSNESNKIADTATSWTARVRVNIPLPLTLSSFPHSIWYSTLFVYHVHTILLQQEDFSDIIIIPTCHFKRSSSRSSCV